MIEEISIRDLGVIEQATLPLGPGFTALTGETGAGKTMVVSALGLLLGARADSGAVRAGSASAVVEGRWLVDSASSVIERVQDAGGSVDDGELILGRSLSSGGRSRATVGGRSAPVGVLSEIGEQLVVVHGQSDQMRLRSATAQRQALDRYAGEAVSSVAARYRDAFTRWHAAQSRLDELVTEQERRLREADDLRTAMTEIEAAAPTAGEDDRLAEAAERLGNLEELRIAAAEAHEALSSEETDDGRDALAQLTAARRSLERVAGHDAQLQPIAEAVAAASFAVSEAAADLASYLGGLDAEGARELETVQERRAELAALVRKYGPTLDDTLRYLETGSARLLELDDDESRIEALRAEVDSAQAEVLGLADELSAARVAHAAGLSKRVTEELAALAMGTATLTVSVADRSEYGLSGKDSVEFLLAPHPGAEPRALGKGASGGELSRVMLAIEVVIAGNDPVPTFIFDEVDAGVGGASATEIGRRLAALSRSAQVIVVTHLAQVAAFAGNHLRVTKDASGEVTASSVEQLEGAERVAEMARLLSGEPDSETALAHARELLENAGTLTRS